MMDKEYCDLCTTYTNQHRLFSHMNGTTYRLCRDCIEMVEDSQMGYTKVQSDKMFMALLMIVANPPEYTPVSKAGWDGMLEIEKARALLKEIAQSNEYVRDALNKSKG